MAREGSLRWQVVYVVGVNAVSEKTAMADYASGLCATLAGKKLLTAKDAKNVHEVRKVTRPICELL
jgi:hypothetical protein